MHGFTSILAQATSRSLGLDKLKSSVRSDLRNSQAHASLRLLPAMSFAALVVLACLLLSAAAAGKATIIGIWAVVCACMQVGIVLAASQLKAREVLSKAQSRAIELCAAAAGTVWGVGLYLAISDPSLPLRYAGLTATAGVALLTVLLLAIFPAGGLLFLALALGGAMMGLTLVPAPEAVMPAAIIVCLFGGAPLLALLPARVFVGFLANKVELREQREIIGLLLKEFGAHPSDWLWHFDRDRRIDNVSARFAAATGIAGGPVGRDFSSFLRGLSPENEPVALEIEMHIEERSIFHDVVVKIDRTSGESWWRLTGKPSFDPGGDYRGYIGSASDITSERLAERKINFLAHHDVLTGLLNRARFTEHLKQAVARLERYGSPFSVLYLDLDRFKFVNDSRGHLTGDRLLVQVSQRLSECLDESNVAARLGGDEFAIIVTDNCGIAEMADLASQLVDSLCKPYVLDDEIVSIGASIGIAMAPINGTRPDQILRNADLALYRAKAEGRGSYRFFETHMDSSMRERRMLELELKEAIKNEEFVLYYQPLVSAEDHRPNGFEALMRWNHPIRGIVPPAEFIPIAEQSGLIQQIGDWTIREVCMAAARWPNDLVVAVNVSSKHFQMSDIVSVVSQALADSKLPPERLELEITESLLIQRPDEVVAKLSAIKALGVTIAMDDFGTGYSSLSYLMKFPFDKIKIDKSFVTASSDDMIARDILRTISSLGKSLKIRITAEGVETLEQVEFLRDIACTQLQGFYFAKPLNETDLSIYFLEGAAQAMRSPDKDRVAAA